LEAPWLVDDNEPPAKNGARFRFALGTTRRQTAAGPRRGSCGETLARGILTPNSDRFQRDQELDT